MASASTVSPAPSKFASSFRHNHVILSPPSIHENVNLALSASSSFLTNFASSVCSQDTTANYTTSSTMATFVFQEDKQSVKNPTSQNPSSTILNETSNSITSVCSNEVETKPDTTEPMSVQEFDDNSSNSNSTHSSSDISSTSRKKRRRGEGQILMADLFGIDKSLADDISNNLKIQSQTSNDATNITVNSSEPGDECNQKKSKEDSPAFHLRPRRSHKSAGYSSSGSSSPIYYLSPIKRAKSKSPLKANNKYLHQLFTDTAEKLNKHLSDCSNKGDSNLSVQQVSSKLQASESKPIFRKVSDSILVEVNVSVFSEMISPPSLSANSVYSDNYISLKIVQIKPLRYVDLYDENSDNENTVYPLLELTTVDINDRFDISYTQGIFDDASHSQASDKKLTVFLVGTYASKSEKMLSEGSVISIIMFRTTKVQASPVKKQTESAKKRKVSLAKKFSNESSSYPFQIIVDSPSDTDSKESIKKETGDEVTLESVTDHNNNDLFVQQYIRTPRPSAASDTKWIPLVSISEKWLAPDDPKVLNKSLYIPQTCKPKFESTSRTVKPIALAPASTETPA